MIRAQTVLIACYSIGPLSSCWKFRAILMYLKYQDWKLPFKYFITLEPPQFSESQKNVTSVDGSPQTCPYPVAAANILYFILPLSFFPYPKTSPTFTIAPPLNDGFCMRGSRNSVDWNCQFNFGAEPEWEKWEQEEAGLGNPSCFMFD